MVRLLHPHKLAVHGLHLPLQRIRPEQRRHKKLGKALQCAPQRCRLHLKVEIGVLLGWRVTSRGVGNIGRQHKMTDSHRLRMHVRTSSQLLSAGE